MTTSKEHSVSVADIFCRRADHCLYDHDAKRIAAAGDATAVDQHGFCYYDPVCVYLWTSRVWDHEPHTRKTGNKLLNRHDIWQMAYVSILMAVISLIAHDWLLLQGVSEAVASTMMVNIVVLSKIFYLFNIRTSAPAFSKASFTNPKAFVIIGVMLVLQLLLTYVPFMQSAFHTEDMSLIGWVISAASGMVVLLVTEFDKWLRSRKIFNLGFLVFFRQNRLAAA